MVTSLHLLWTTCRVNEINDTPIMMEVCVYAHFEVNFGCGRVETSTEISDDIIAEAAQDVAIKASNDVAKGIADKIASGFANVKSRVVD